MKRMAASASSGSPARAGTRVTKCSSSCSTVWQPAKSYTLKCGRSGYGRPWKNTSPVQPNASCGAPGWTGPVSRNRLNVG